MTKKKPYKKPKLLKPKRKVRLPCDRTGAPITVGDVIQWDNGERMRVATLTYYGPGYERMGAWTAEDDEGGFTDNLDGAVVVAHVPAGEEL